MKKLIYLLVACLIFTACEKEPMLTLSLDQISASCEGNTTSVTLVSNNPWSVSGTDWCNVSPSSGEAGEINLTITIRENTTYDSRKCTLNFTSKELCSALSVNQESNYGFVSTVENILFSFKAQDSCFVINTNEDINISIDESSKEWLSILETKGLAQRIYQISLKQNNNANRREGKFYFKGVKSGNIRQLVVRQDGVVNLSENETANCYITSKKYFYKFKPTEGNSSAIIDNISSVQVMWETKNTDDVTIGDVTPQGLRLVLRLLLPAIHTHNKGRGTS